MVTSRGAKVAIGVGVIGTIASIAGVAMASQKGTTVPAGNYTLSLVPSQTTGSPGDTITFTATLLLNGTPVSGTPVTLTDLTTGTKSTTNTNDSGAAQFDVTFPNAGTFDMQASAF